MTALDATHDPARRDGMLWAKLPEAGFPGVPVAALHAVDAAELLRPVRMTGTTGFFASVPHAGLC